MGHTHDVADQETKEQVERFSYRHLAIGPSLCVTQQNNT